MPFNHVVLTCRKQGIDVRLFGVLVDKQTLMCFCSRVDVVGRRERPAFWSEQETMVAKMIVGIAEILFIFSAGLHLATVGQVHRPQPTV